MPRRKKKEDAFDLLVEVPWGVTLVMGVVALFVVQGAPCQPSIRTMLYFIPGMIFFASLVSLIKGLEKKLLHRKAKTIEEIKAMSWRDFETFVGEVFRRQGYSVEETGGGGADGGFDLILHKRREKVLVQCKQWRTYQVGVKIVREMFGLMVAEHADRVIIVSVGTYTKDAADFAQGKPIELIDGDKLVLLRNEQEGIERECTKARMRECENAIEEHVRWSKVEKEPRRQEAIKSVNLPPATPTCPRCGAEMILRTARKGANAGNQFWGCSRYPACKGIVQA